MSFIQKLITPPLRWYVNYLAKKSLPKVSGRVKLDGLSANGDIYRDKWGVPHIYAKSKGDLSFLQGYCHGQDRLFQMELTRRVAKGELSEVVGQGALDTDRASRTFGFHRMAKADKATLTDELLGLLERYVEGVNAAIDQQRALPVEFRLLKFEPRKWDVSDVLSIARLMAFQMSYAWLSEITRATLIEKVGPEMAAELDIHYDPNNPVGLQKSGECFELADDGRLGAINGPYLKTISGSNAWAVSGEHTSSGDPILCNDPHLSLSLPAVWYMNHLSGGGLEVTGTSVPGLPLVLIGHNQKIGWGITLSFTDIQDVVIETFSSKTDYSYKGETKAAQIHQEEIKVKDAKPHLEEVVETHNGPIISDILGKPEKKLALRSMCFQDLNILQAWYEINEAKGWNDFVDGVKKIDAPGLNIMYADKKNIGYWVSGKVPKRQKGEGRLPQDGASGEGEWSDFVPFNEMPHTLNPERGYIISCNHKVVDENYPHYLGDSWMNGYRAKRVEQLFADVTEPIRKRDMKAWQIDVHCPPALVLVRELKSIEIPEEYLPLTDKFKPWKGNLKTYSTASTVYEVLRYYLFKEIVTEGLGEELAKEVMGESLTPIILTHNEFYGHDTYNIIRMLKDPEKSKWVEQYGGKEKWVLRSLELTKEYLEKHFGKDPEKWTYGRLHQVQLSHPLSVQAPMDKIFNLGPFPIGGNTDTVCQTATTANNRMGYQLVAASYRQILTPAKWQKSECIMPPGQSGNVASPHYSDLFKKWLNGETIPMLWDKEVIKASAKAHLKVKAAAVNNNLT